MANQVRIEKAGPLPAPFPAREPAVPQGTLASQLVDAAAAQLLLADELPADERPRARDRVLLVGLVWGGQTLVEIEQVETGADLRAGKLFDLPAVQLPKAFALVRHEGDRHVVSMPATLRSEVHTRGEVRSFGELASEARAGVVEAPFRGHAYPIDLDDRVVVRVAPHLTLVARYVRAGKASGKSFLESLDIGFASTLFAAIAFLVAFVMMVRLAPRTVPGSAEDLEAAQNRIAQYVAKPQPPKEIEQPRFKDLSGAPEGAKAQAEEGKLGKEEAKKKEADPSRKGSPTADLNKKEADRRKIAKLGLVAALAKVGAGAGAASNVIGPGGIGSGVNTSLGGVTPGAGLGDPYGVGGLGARGTGSGGGGTAIGIGGLGIKGSGSGAGGYGGVELGGKGKEETRFIPGKTVVIGGLSRDVINRIIQRHYNEVKYCYEKELTRDPGLYGKVSVLFVIDGTGRVADALVQQTTLSSEPVESCILQHVKRWVFPQPEGGSTVQVTYPYVFKSAQ
ncbi:MAG: energy transducer TonB [Deltaproteobacteria bacterium]|nr:MAG: energy transducer TonB [Deltaproteobacteria bacterium]